MRTIVNYRGAALGSPHICNMCDSKSIRSDLVVQICGDSGMNIAAVVVAGGRGVRAGSGVPKQFRSVCGRTVMARAMDPLLSHPAISECVAVISSEDRDYFDSTVARTINVPIKVAAGGRTRSESVENGLTLIKEMGFTHVLIHDAVRPFLSEAVLERVIKSLDRYEGSVPVVPIADALWSASDGLVEYPVSREKLFRAQTPQAFEFDGLLDAYRGFSGIAADDAAVAVAAGMKVAAVPGCDNNFKITVAEDFVKAERALATACGVRVGQGFDVHARKDGQKVILLGVEIPCDFSLLGHSDADVAMHAVTDALYGAVAEGDIGVWFPPGDDKWKDADSSIFLKHAAELIAKKGYFVSGIDCTIICEYPMIAPYAEKMKGNIAQILNIETGCVSVKATTTERLGFIGRKEAIAALAVATVTR